MQNIELAQISQDIVERFTTAAEYWRCYRANDTQSGMGSMGDAARRRQQWALIVCKPRFDILFRMLKHANVPPFLSTFPASQPWDAPDPLPVMRREMKLLLIELSQLCTAARF